MSCPAGVQIIHYSKSVSITPKDGIILTIPVTEP